MDENKKVILTWPLEIENNAFKTIGTISSRLYNRFNNINTFYDAGLRRYNDKIDTSNLDSNYNAEVEKYYKIIIEKAKQTILKKASFVIAFLPKRNRTCWLELFLHEAKQSRLPILAVDGYRTEKYSNSYKNLTLRNIGLIHCNHKTILKTITTSGKSLEYKESNLSCTKPIEKDIIDFNEILLNKFKSSPNLLHNLSSREFEEFIAYIMLKRNYKVSLTAKTKDNGVDIYAIEKDDKSKILLLIECKKYRIDRPVGIKIIREMIGTLIIHEATHGIVVSSSYFSKEARDRISKLELNIGLKDHMDILNWINKLD
ncbi:restriction endonuclease [Bacteroidota bacterium]